MTRVQQTMEIANAYPTTASSSPSFVSIHIPAHHAVSRISLVRPSMSRQIEDLLVRMARQGQLRGKVGDAELKGLLEQVSCCGRHSPLSGCPES
jgi:hypothetical protein